MRVDEAMLLALREFADPSCRRCQGRGAKGDDLVASLCDCVRRRVRVGPGALIAESDDDALPHPWGIITRRAQHIHAAVLLEAVPENWS